MNDYLELRRRGLLFLPFFLAVPLLFGLGFRYAGYSMEWRAFGLGALGWLIALMLRGPLAAVLQKRSQETIKRWMIVGSGVFEETVRVIMLLLTAVTASWAVSFGQGWAAIEVLYTMINVAVIASLIGRTDEKAKQAIQYLEQQGTLHASPLWGILERIWASAFHIGCTLIAARFPWLVVVLIPLHSGLNAIGVKLAAQAVWKSSAAICIIGVLILIIGIVIQ
ncbi:hypothetical protein [Paenibacillus sp. MMO-177]|uniref:hypothetical protein n=1 Tax=Paenibacillus sp. MMO-177 TaxID=3081289 RepID=UPI003015A137